MMVAVGDRDDHLLEAFAKGDPDAFVAFYRRHLASVLAFFLRRTGDPELTADLTAEVFAAALLSARRYQPGEKPALAWLYGIAWHKLTDSRRRGRVEARARKRLALEPLVIEDEDIARIDQLAAAADRELRLEAAVQELPKAQRDAVLARVVEERPYVEIAERMACSEMVVRQRVSRGLRTLRTQIKELR
jgi:RNA polymerase sigma-70 factor (ECF subfamily)